MYGDGFILFEDGSFLWNAAGWKGCVPFMLCDNHMMGIKLLVLLIVLFTCLAWISLELKFKEWEAQDEHD